MRQYLDETDKINAIRLQLRHPSGNEKVWILVEGESDQKLFGGLIDGQNARVECVHGGLTSLRKAVETLAKETKQVIGIRDADFLHLENKSESVPFLYLTDYHDAELMMIASDRTLASLVAEYLNVNTYQPAVLREQILQSITFLGYVRWYNHQRDGRLNFNKLALSNFLDVNTLSVQVEVCVREIHARSSDRRIDIETDVIQSMQTDGIDLLQLCNGHDFGRALALFITGQSNLGVKEKEIGKALRLSYTKEEFQKTTLFESLKEWERVANYVLFG